MTFELMHYIYNMIYHKQDNPKEIPTAQISSNLPTRATSGRALFQAGANANDQGNNRGWDFTPYPPIPSFVAIPGPTQYCPGDTFQALLSLTKICSIT